MSPPRPLILLAVVATLGCASEEPLRETRTSMSGSELRALVPATFSETYAAVFDGLERGGWLPTERQRDAFLARVDGSKDGRTVRVRLKRMADGNTLVGLRLEPAGLEEELRALVPGLLGRLEPRDPPQSPEDPYVER